MNIEAGKAILSHEELFELVQAVFLRAGIERHNSFAMAKVVTMAEVDDCRSHGVYRVSGCVGAVISGKVDPLATPVIMPSKDAVVRIDARKGFAPSAIDLGRQSALETAKRAGVCTLAVNNCYHFSALWADLEEVAEAGYVGLAFTLGRHGVALPGGRRPAFGTNPMAFAFPRSDGKRPFVFDMSSSIVARGEIELHHLAGKPIPQGWCMDHEGNATTDTGSALNGAILPFGGHKGAAIGLMVELLAGPLIGDLTSSEALSIDRNDGGPLLGGYLMIVIDPSSFTDRAGGIMAADRWLASLARENPGSRLPSSRRYLARDKARLVGVPLELADYEKLEGMA